MRLFDCRQEPDKKQHNIAAFEKRPRSEAYFTNRMAPAVGFEPTTNRLTADRSTTELRWIKCLARRREYSLPRESRAASRFQICKINLVAGAGFEPAVRQLADYELSRCKPVIVKKPFPRPC